MPEVELIEATDDAGCRHDDALARLATLSLHRSECLLLDCRRLATRERGMCMTERVSTNKASKLTDVFNRLCDGDLARRFAPRRSGLDRSRRDVAQGALRY